MRKQLVKREFKWNLISTFIPLWITKRQKRAERLFIEKSEAKLKYVKQNSLRIWMHFLFIKMLIAHFSIYYKLLDKIRSRHQRNISWLAFDNQHRYSIIFNIEKKMAWIQLRHKIVANCYGFMWTVNTFEPKYIWMPSQWRFKFVSVPPHFVWISPTKKSETENGQKKIYSTWLQILNIKSVHFKKTVAQSSFLSKVLSFLLTLFWFQRKWQHLVLKETRIAKLSS